MSRSNFTEELDFEIVTGPGAEPGMTLEEAYALLTQVPSADEPMVAAANEGHTGAMIALVPSEADVARLQVEGGEDPEQLHMTLLFLGDASKIDDETRERIFEITRVFAPKPVGAEAFSVNIFNPGDAQPDRETCVVLGIGNDGDGVLHELRGNLMSAIRGMSGFTLPEQHTPWVPHVTLVYTDNMKMAAKLTDRVGPLTFDRLRIAFGDDVTDIPLGPDALSMDDEVAEEIMTSAAIAGNIMHALANDRGLRRYWTRGAGAAKIRWGTDGSFDRCVRQLGKHVTRPQGLCAEYHKEATGEWPAEKGVESSMTTPLVAHGDHSQHDDDDDDNSTLTAAARKKKVNTYADEPWEGVLSVEGIESGDGRLFSLGSLDWADLPLPLMYQPANVGGHDASIAAGSITRVARKGNEIYGWGHVFGNMLAGEYGDGIRNMMKVGGVSVDVDKVKDADVEMIYAAGDEGNFMAKPQMSIYHRGRIRGATLVAFPAFTEAKLSFTNDVVTAASDVSCDCGDQILTAAGHTIVIPDAPPAHWFDEPTDVKSYGALTITDEGRVFGWLAPSDTTHRSVRKQVPMGKVDYSRWMNKETITADGGRVVTGVITGNCGHAPTQNYGTLDARKDHYDNSCSIFANVRLGEKLGKGVWFAGALRHGVTAEQVAAAMGCSLSGDWQPHPDRPGVQEFIAALLVPVPGFPMARSQASVVMQDGVITAASVPVRFGEEEPPTQEELAFNAIELAKTVIMRKFMNDRKAAIMASVEE